MWLLESLDAADAGVHARSRVQYRGKLYRALNPVYAREPLSGRGAKLYGGRFNPKGAPALYLSLSLDTAIREANRAGSLQPTTIVAYDADIDNVFDTRDTDALAGLSLTASDLADPAWRDLMKRDGIAPTQQFALGCIAQGHHGLLVRSFARGTGEGDSNLGLRVWGDAGPARLAVADDQDRLRI
ncbi:RES family NAD+ phosphorylase [Altericroceibacterium xinjiangense]|uniref:RES family NAD+ phosphorylase n=1 Tax=Altericroceibacterium xinjiangense TaxID=762261 RepID=UPI0019D051B1|nr:RES domain-containing protein [Altericroceibacterium xinjiangense]